MVDCNEQMVELLLGLGVEFAGPNVDHGTVLGHAVLVGDTNLVQAILALTPEIEVTDIIMVGAVSNQKHAVAILELLLCTETTLEITSPMMIAAASIYKSDSHVLKFMLDRGGKINDGIMQVAAMNGGS